MMQSLAMEDYCFAHVLLRLLSDVTVDFFFLQKPE